MHYVYLLQSKKDKGYYIGHTSDLRNRIRQHHRGKTRSIKSRSPFILVYYEAYLNKKDAKRREIELKKKGQQREILLERVKNSLLYK